MKNHSENNDRSIPGLNRPVGLAYLVMCLVVTIASTAPRVLASLDRGIIQGAVRDPQGAVVPGAKVTVLNVATGTSATLTTNSEGVYLAAQLLPGTYTVHAEAGGFQPLDITGVKVTAGSTSTVDVSLKLGTATQTVRVTAAPSLIENTATNFNVATLTATTIDRLPLEGRDIQTLVQLMPGVTQSTGPSGSVFGFDSQFGGFPDPQHLVGSGISANGSQGGANAWYLDGSVNASLGAENVVVNPSPDAVSEFSVIDNGLAAEWGLTSGGVVNVVLKSGTKEFHGDLYEFNRNSSLSATNPFDRRDAQGNPLVKPRVNYNDFGGTLGGPIRIPHIYNGKNRTFFFFSFDASPLHENINRILTVPLVAEKNGNFTGDPRFAAVCDPAAGVTNCLYNPYSTTGPNANGLFNRTPFTTPVLPASMLDPVAQFYLSSYPAPNFVDPLQQGPGGCGIYCNNFLGEVGSSQTTKNMSIKIDHSISPKHQFFGEWLYNPSYYYNYRYPWNGPTAQTTAGVAGAQPYTTDNNIFSLGLTSTFTSTLVNEARVSFSRQAQVATPNPENTVDDAEVLQHVQGLNFLLYSPFQTVPDVSIGGIGGFGPQEWQNAIQGTQAITFTDNVTKLVGKHTLKGGLMFRRDNLWNVAAWGYGLGFGGTLTANPVSGLGGAGLAQFLLGAVDQGSGTGEYYSPWTSNDTWSMYLQDDHRVKKNLTLSVGLRYDIPSWFVERRNNLANFNFTGTNPDVPYPGRLDYVATPDHPGRTVFPAHKNDLGPRVSFAWSPTRNTVVRGGVGIIYSNGLSTALGDQLGAVSGPGFSEYIGIYGDYTGQRPAFKLSQGAPASSLDLPPLNIARTTDEQFLGTGPELFLQGSKDPYVEQWNFQIQRQLPGDMALTVGYVGTHGLHLYGDIGRNYDYIHTAVVQNLREDIYNDYPTNPAIGAIYGCGTSCPGTLALLPYPQYSSLYGLISPDGYSRYNSLQVKFDKRLSHGLNFLIAYTIQKTIDSENLGSLIGNTATPTTLGRTVGRTGLVAGGAAGGAGDGFKSAGAENPDDRAAYAGLAPDDIPQILNLAVTYDLPMGPGKGFLSGGGWGSKLAGGWRFVQNWNFQSGVPLLITSAACNGLSCRPNLIGNPQAGRSSESRQQQENQWFNPDAFEAPFGSDPAVIQAITSGTADYNTLDSWWQFGNDTGRNPSQRAPGFWNANMSLQKDFHFTEERYFQFRFEVLNALNHQSLGLPNTSWCLPPYSDGSTDAIHIFGCQFGKITNVQTDPRAIEFGVKFYF